MKSIPVVYSDALKMSSDEWISLSKPDRLMTLIEPEIDFTYTPDPATAKDLYFIHSKEYVDGVLDGSVRNGFSNTRRDIADHALHTNGAFVMAAELAMEHGVAFAPVSGFHHANYSWGHGFCTFNGLMLAALKLINEHYVDNVLILDFDGHTGDGTEDIIESLCLQRNIRHLTRRHNLHNAKQAVELALSEIAKKPDIVFYQAGADSLDTDPFGAGYFSAEEWLKKDALIFEACRRLEVPIVWNLAGGYDGTHTIKMHYATWRVALETFTGPPLQYSAPLTKSGLNESLPSIRELRMDAFRNVPSPIFN